MPRSDSGRPPHRPKGSKNKATIERELKLAIEIDKARKDGRELAVDVLERMMKLAEGAAGQHKPPSAAEISAGAAALGDWDKFGEWFDRIAWCAKELAKYQSPQLRAIAVTMPGQPRDMKTVEGKVLDVNDPLVVQRAYISMVKTKARA